MIIGIGTDMVDQRRIISARERFGERFIYRVLNPQEREQFAQSKKPDNFLAKRYAIKEAAAKALGVGIGAKANLHDFSVVKAASGAPNLLIEGVAAMTASALGVGQCHVSISDELPYILAFVVLSRDKDD